MRYPRGHKDETRRRIVTAAGQRFRTSGYKAAGVDQVMGDAGLTPGGFYAHFASKEELLAETLSASAAQVRSVLLAGLDDLEGEEWLRAVVGRYLSRTHRDDPAAGCTLAALGGEIAREGEGARQALQHYVAGLAREIAPRVPALPGLEAEDRVLATIALLAGALMLSRAVPDRTLSDRILRAAQRLAVPAKPSRKRRTP